MTKCQKHIFTSSGHYLGYVEVNPYYDMLKKLFWATLWITLPVVLYLTLSTLPSHHPTDDPTPIPDLAIGR